MSTTYREQLLGKKWMSRRNRIIVDSKWTCSNCENRKIIERSIPGSIKRVTFKGSWEISIPATPHRFKFEIELVTPDDKTEYVVTLYPHGMLPQTNFSSYKLYYEVVEDNKIIVNAISELWPDGFVKWKHVRGLHVHHKYYQDNLLPWDYPPDALTTLCWMCHEELHANQQVQYLDRNGNEKGRITPCFRCHGAGYFPEYDHVEDGVCFRCRRAKYEELLPL